MLTVNNESMSKISKLEINLVSPLQENTILVSIDGKKTHCLIDTGTTISCASLAFLKKTNVDVSS